MCIRDSAGRRPDCADWRAGLPLPVVATTEMSSPLIETRQLVVEVGGRCVVNHLDPVSYTHLRAHETVLDLVCRLLLEKKNKYYAQHVT